MTDNGPPPFDLAAHLRDALGVDPDLVDAAEAEGPEQVRRLAQAVVLLGEPPRLRPPDAWQRTGADEELARALWRAMGFANVPDEAVALTEADVVALAAINDFLQASGISADTAIRFARLLGQTMSRVADALHSIVDHAIDEMDGLPPGENDDLMVLAAQLVNPLIEQELSYLLRRHLYAGAIRRIAGHDLEQPDVTVGFADVVSFTRLSGKLAEADLAELLETFEATTADMITERGGRVIKLIGDAVLFVFDEPEPAARLALELVDSFGGDQPDLRIGLTHGPVLSRLGDLFGPPVNLASRLVSYARPGSVLVDQRFVDRLGPVEDLRLRSVRPRDLKGIGTTALYVLRRDDR
ncbi:adenylate/guanylate cyclase domain-containing protein [Acidimicrobiia bacterium EGI L10123]|uniref:adenylate/guanylate cyclase domain-containing protein n=1 Tax=Salinilacustrithrix flava TaxID=2957203 RepID=UPI003D7C2F5C|nr:adenylate/guanylate cyclase domain-containing protein [Acidimicrobiia bacterium EGI L10123]